MEMQYFVKARERRGMVSVLERAADQLVDRLGIRKEKLRFHQHSEKELAHYAKSGLSILSMNSPSDGVKLKAFTTGPISTCPE